jgi:hypothetical protein
MVIALCNRSLPLLLTILRELMQERYLFGRMQWFAQYKPMDLDLSNGAFRLRSAKKRKHGWATNLKRDTFRHFGSMAIPQSNKI